MTRTDGRTDGEKKNWKVAGAITFNRASCCLQMARYYFLSDCNKLSFSDSTLRERISSSSQCRLRVGGDTQTHTLEFDSQVELVCASPRVYNSDKSIVVSLSASLRRLTQPTTNKQEAAAAAAALVRLLLICRGEETGVIQFLEQKKRLPPLYIAERSRLMMMMRFPSYSTGLAPQCAVANVPPPPPPPPLASSERERGRQEEGRTCPFHVRLPVPVASTQERGRKKKL